MNDAMSQQPSASVSHDDHGSTPAAWTTVTIITIAFILGTLAVMFGNWPLFWGSAALVVVGVLLALLGLAVAVGYGWTAAGGPGEGPDSALAIVGGALVALVGAWTVSRGRTWPSMGSRYERAGTASRRTPRLSDWEALDRGIDPTTDPADPRPGSTSG